MIFFPKFFLKLCYLAEFFLLLLILKKKRFLLIWIFYYYYYYRCNCYVWFITLIASLYTRENKEKIRKRMEKTSSGFEGCS